jgi:hypothetical protein
MPKYNILLMHAASFAHLNCGNEFLDAGPTSKM